MYLLDTNVCVRYLRNPESTIGMRIQGVDPAEIALCDVVKAELYYGAHRSADPANGLNRLRLFFGVFYSYAFDGPAAEQYGRIRADLLGQNAIIGPYDMQIAATALANGLTLVTHNIRDFGRVAGLKLED